MRVIDSRRLFGPNLDCPGPAAIAEVEFEPGEDEEAALARWRAAVPAGALVRRFRGGAALVIPGPIDQALALCDVNEAAIEGRPVAWPTEIDPALRALQDAARARGLPVLVDDEQVSVGLGRGARVFPRHALPAEVDWSRVGTVPVALVTGTNGKTTSARLLAAIAAAAGHTVGLATTDGIQIGGALLAAGDYTGPEAARQVLRHPAVTLAVLETARGGILRRGLAVDHADVALITNVAADHLGLHGIDDVATMAQVKAVAGSVADTVVVNADDPLLMALPFRRRATFSLAGADAVVDIPIAFGGAARHNLANALGAAAAARALGLDEDAIRRGLDGFRPDDNPGRGNLVTVGPARVLLDFGHNADAVRAALALAAGLGPRRLVVVTGLPGDRDDEALRAVARELAAARPARVYLHDLHGYLRGRQPGAVPALLEAELAATTPTERTAGEADGVARALAAAEPGDLIVVLPHLEREAVAAVLATR